MNSSYPLKNLPALLQVLIRPMLFISLALHGLLLLIPMSDESETDVREQVDKPVKVTQLPTTPTAPAVTSPKVSPKTPTPKPTPRIIATPVSRQPAVSSRPIIQASPQPKPVQATPSPSPAASPQAATTTTPSPKPTTSNALAEFPVYPGAKAGCLEVQSCFQTGNPLDRVGAYFEKELPARGFTAPVEIDEPGSRKVYQVTRNDFSTQYLSLINTEQGTIYVLAEEPRTLEDLKNAVVVPPEFYSILAEVGEGIEDESIFANPNDFYTKLSSEDEGSLIPAEQREEIQGMKLVSGKTPDTVYANLTPSLQSIFEISRSGSYGGGPLYKLKKDTFTGYLNLVQTKDATGTIVVLWAEPPA